MTRTRLSGPGLALSAVVGAAFTAVVSAAISTSGPALANSTLLDSVKQNPQRAKDLCAQLKGLNGQGLSYTSPQAVAQIAAEQGLNSTDAEILSTYVVGLYCPDVR